MGLMGYSGARGTLIYEKNLMSKILCQTPFKGTGRNIFYFKFSAVARSLQFLSASYYDGGEYLEKYPSLSKNNWLSG
jgi:hypothetical protein